MTDSQLRALLATDEGKRLYAAVIGDAQADGIRAYKAAKANGASAHEANLTGEAAKNASLAKRMGA